MQDVTRKRLWRKLEALPDEQLYQVLDYIEFLQSRYAPDRAPEPTGFQRFAERFEDRLRARALLPRAMSGAMKLLGATGHMLEGVAEVGRHLLSPGGAGAGQGAPSATRAPAREPAASTPVQQAAPPDAGPAPAGDGGEDRAVSGAG
ncbi:MAG: DUF2281 domain-containing protein [Gemmatimonadetes bacterium]|nr:DUF2281 domain-containing protein [Gemmatimonadota bacterium]